MSLNLYFWFYGCTCMLFRYVAKPSLQRLINEVLSLLNIPFNSTSCVVFLSNPLTIVANLEVSRITYIKRIKKYLFFVKHLDKQCFLRDIYIYIYSYLNKKEEACNTAWKLIWRNFQHIMWRLIILFICIK